MRTLRSSLILSHILPLLLVVPLVGVALVYLVETQVMLSDLSERLRAEAQLIAETLELRPDVWEDAQQAEDFISDISEDIPDRVYLISRTGNLIVTGQAGEIDPTETSIDPQGIDTALSGIPSIQVSYGIVRQNVHVYIPVKNLDQQLVGIIALSGRIEGVAQQFNRIRLYIIFILLIELVFGGLIGLYLANRLGRPIHQVSDAVVDIAHGERNQPVPETGPQELRDLSTAVNYLSRQLTEMEETRRRMLANIVHELGRPLAAILSAVHVLRQGAGDDVEVREELLAGIQDEVTRMKPLLDDLAQLHGQVLGNVELNLQLVPLSDWLPPLLLPWRTSALDKGLQWQVDIPRGLPQVPIDPDRMAQVTGNLLSNAVKYTPVGGEISVSAGLGENEVWIQVVDSGPGISLEEQERVFEAFYRSHKDRRFPQGLGLGLTIARDLVELHGGRLELKSETGQGSQFTIYLPVP